VKRINIYGGVNLSVISTDKFKTNFISVNIISPLLKETASKNSLLTDVLKRGCKSYPTLRDINIKLDELYASSISVYVKKKGEVQTISFAASMLDNLYTIDNTDLMAENLKILSELIFEPYLENGVFSTTYVESEKKQLIDRINEQINNKSTYAMNRCLEIMCNDETYSVKNSGNIADVEVITPEILFDHYKKVISDYAVEISFVGNMQPEEVAGYINKYLSGFKPRMSAMPLTDVIRKATPKPEFVEPMPVVQGKLSLGFRMGTVLTDKEYPAFALLNELFGGSPSSLLFTNVREKLSLCYYCSSIPEAHKGVMIVASGIENENKEQAEKAILEQLETVRNNKFTDEEFELAKKSIINAYKEIPDSTAGMYNWYLSRILAGLSSSPLDAAEAITKVTREEVVASAKKVGHEMTYFLKGTLKKEEQADE